MDKPFSITGATYLVGTTPVQVGIPTGGGNSYRVFNTSASVVHFTTGVSSSVTSLTPSATGAINTIGMLPNSVEVFSNLLPWMVCSAAAALEVTQGDGV